MICPRENKNPFGFCTDLDREGDTRVLANIDESHYWMTVMLHEFGHAAYFKYVDRNLPFILRRYAHTLTTEAIAMFFGRMNKYPHWVERFLGLDKGVVRELSPALQKMLQRQMLVSVRWMIAFVYFEREFYENPELPGAKWHWKEKIQLATGKPLHPQYFVEQFVIPSS